MKTLVAVHVVQFSLWEYETFEISAGGTGVIGPNGAGKTSLVDAVQIAMVGGHGQHLHFNAQSVHKDSRSIRAYALGTMRSGDGESGVLERKRDEALSYITLVFRGQNDADVVSAGICIHATVADHRVLGLYVLPGVTLKLEHHLENIGDGGKASIDWEIFAQHGRAQSRASGREPTITTRPEQYVQELLHQVQQGVDVRKFLRAFGHSINLKAVGSVGEFLRGYLVESTPIDKRGTLQHIKTLRRLGQQIEDVKAQVVRLEDIDKVYGKLEKLFRQKAVARAVRLQLAMESEDQNVENLDAEVNRLKQELANGQRDLPHLQQQMETTRGAFEKVFGDLKSDPEAQQPEQIAQLRKAYEDGQAQARNDLDRMTLSIREAMQETVVALEVQHPEHAEALAIDLARWDGWAGAGHVATIDEVKAVLDLLRACEVRLAELLGAAQQADSRAKNAARSASATLQAINQGKRITDSDVADAGVAFEGAGIKYEPVASLVRVVDPHWQGPIESFLGPHRLALLVESGREDEAVRLVRQERINDVTIVQPEHFRDEIGRVPPKDTVAALLDSQDPVALAFLRRILGRMKRVETAQQLRNESRALTVDYMLSANGGTKRLRPLEQSRWMLGVELSNADRVDALESHRAASREATKAANYLKLVEVAIFAVRAALKQVSLATYDSGLTAFQAAAKNVKATIETAVLPVSERLEALKAEVDAARARADTANKKMAELQDSIARIETTLQQRIPALEKARTQLAALEKDLAAAMQDQDCDHESLPVEYARLLEAIEAEGIEKALSDFDHRQHQWNSQIPGVEGAARDAFVGYINEHSIGLLDERSDWRKAALWVQGYIRKLRDSTLMDYEKEAQDARVAAEQSFRSDVKFKMREAIQRVRHEIRDLNQILQTCPAFTNGEKYQFVAHVSPTHKPLYDLILASDDGDGFDLFGRPEVHGNLMSLLEASESGKDRGNNPLEDYRLLFNFDLQILQDGKVVDYLSKRMGVASNGEHRVPFYVIAGAALATAYRIRPGAPKVGAGLMILDEAFYGMDAQNTYVTADFLKSLGLQLLMAGPDSDVGKLSPLMDNYYDLARYGMDIFAEHVVIKEAAHRLFTTDIPLLHPELIDAKEAQLLAAEGS